MRSNFAFKTGAKTGAGGCDTAFIFLFPFFFYASCGAARLGGGSLLLWG